MKGSASGKCYCVRNAYTVTVLSLQICRFLRIDCVTLIMLDPQSDLVRESGRTIRPKL